MTVMLPDIKRDAHELPGLRERLRFAFELNLLAMRNRELAIAFSTHQYCTPRGRRGEPESDLIFGDAKASAGASMAASLPSVEEISKLLATCKTGNLDIDGERVRCYLWMRSKGSRAPVVVFAHGWESYGMAAYPLIRTFIRAGWQVVSFDQRAHGASSGHHAALPEFARTLRTVITKVGKVDLVVGHCLGATSALYLQARGQIDIPRLAMISPHADPIGFTYDFAKRWLISERIRKGMLSNIEASFRMEYRHAVPEIIGPRLSLPMIAFHDPEDKFVPYRYAQRLERHAKTLKLVESPGIGHFGGLVSPEVHEQILRFARPQTGTDNTPSLADDPQPPGERAGSEV